MTAILDIAVRDEFYHLLEQAVETQLEWDARLATLRRWRVLPRFEAFWKLIDQMLEVDFPSYRRRLKTGLDSAAYDFDAWHAQREFDLKHAHDHLP